MKHFHNNYLIILEGKKSSINHNCHPRKYRMRLIQTNSQDKRPQVLFWAQHMINGSHWSYLRLYLLFSDPLCFHRSVNKDLLGFFFLKPATWIQNRPSWRMHITDSHLQAAVISISAFSPCGAHFPSVLLFLTYTHYNTNTTHQSQSCHTPFISTALPFPPRLLYYYPAYSLFS